MTSDERSLRSGDFPVHWPVLTRWTDNDMFGHLNNSVYDALFDTASDAESGCCWEALVADDGGARG